MKGLAAGLLASVACLAPVLAQAPERALERLSLALQQPPPTIRGVAPTNTAAPKTLGIFTLVPPSAPGEIVRVSVPIGELVSRAFKGVAAAHRRHQEASARREVAAALQRFTQQRDRD